MARKETFGSQIENWGNSWKFCGVIQRLGLARGSQFQQVLKLYLERLILKASHGSSLKVNSMTTYLLY